MNWAPGWYGWDVDSEDAAAWGPFSASEDAKGHPDVFAPDDAEVRVFYISVSDTPRHKDWANDARQSAIWIDGPDSEAARAFHGERSAEPDPAHTPAVRRVVAYLAADGPPCLDVDDAYAEAADALLMRAWEGDRLDIGEGDWWSHWPPQRRHGLAQWLRRRDSGELDGRPFGVKAEECDGCLPAEGDAP